MPTKGYVRSDRAIDPSDVEALCRDYRKHYEALVLVPDMIPLLQKYWRHPKLPLTDTRQLTQSIAHLVRSRQVSEPFRTWFNGARTKIKRPRDSDRARLARAQEAPAAAAPSEKASAKPATKADKTMKRSEAHFEQLRPMIAHWKGLNTGPNEIIRKLKISKSTFYAALNYYKKHPAPALPPAAATPYANGTNGASHKEEPPAPSAVDARDAKELPTAKEVANALQTAVRANLMTQGTAWSKLVEFTSR